MLRDTGKRCARKGTSQTTRLTIDAVVSRGAHPYGGGGGGGGCEHRSAGVHPVCQAHRPAGIRVDMAVERGTHPRAARPRVNSQASWGQGMPAESAARDGVVTTC